MSKQMTTMDGNTAAAYIAYAFSELAAVYPITPSSTMAEVIEEWSAKSKRNLFGEVMNVVTMQSEAGAAGAVHGSLKSGALTTTFTSSQGLLLMIPNMYKIAGELLPTVFHIASRAVTTNALSIFGDHGDVMAARQTGFCMLAESSVQEVMDLSGVAHLASLKASLPFMNFFDGFRTSHELQKIEKIPYESLKKLVPQKELAEFRKRAMNPNHPTVSGTSQNPDIHFQQRETVNRFYDNVPEIVQEYMAEINKIRGTHYDLTNYYGHKEATEIIVSMGSVSPTIIQTVDYLNQTGRKVGHINIHLYRPFPVKNLLKNLPHTVEKVAVLDRTKEPGANGEPLLLDVQSALYRHPNRPIVIGGRYGLGSKDVAPNQIKAVFDHLLLSEEELKDRFTIGIVDDVTHLSLPVDDVLDLTPKETFQAKFWGFGSDGTVGASKQAIKIIGNHTDLFAQAYFSYDSKKSGGLTNAYLRFGDQPINSPYLIEEADFIGCHNASYIHQYDLLKELKEGGIFLLNTTWSEKQVLKLLPKQLKKEIASKKIQFYIINGMEIAQKANLGRKINTIMSTAFFELTHLFNRCELIKYLKEEVEQAYGKKSSELVASNCQAIDETFSHLIKVDVPKEWENMTLKEKPIDLSKPRYVREILEPINRQEGDSLTVKNLIDNDMTDGSVPLGTTAYEKRGVALEVPEWEMDKCTMCNECAFVCPHAAIRPFLLDEEEEKEAPEGFLTRKMKGADGLMYRIQVSLEDCTGCGLCVDVCPAKGKALVMKPYDEQKEQAINWAFAMTLKQKANPVKKIESIKGSQFEQPLLEFSGACSGCGETPYIKLLTQLYGDRMLIANATGCSSIWGGASPSTPYTTNNEGQGPAWSNSLFEDNAEFGLGMYLAYKTKRQYVANEVKTILDEKIGSDDLRRLMSNWLEELDKGAGSRQRATKLEAVLKEEKQTSKKLQALYDNRDLFVKSSQWIIGGDGWAYDIGFGGIDHVLSSGEDVNIFVMDNEIYANTGGQTSKATPSSAIAKFDSQGKKTGKKNLGLIAMTYGNVYVAQVALNANPTQTIRAITEAESYPGPSLIIGYVPCIAHGVEGGMSRAIQVTKDAVESGYWPIYRYDPRLIEKNKEPLKIDFKRADYDKLTDFFKEQTRFSSLETIYNTEEMAHLLEKPADDAIEQGKIYKDLSGK